MTEDWAAVARAINQRVNKLGLRQRELAERSQVSQAIVREIQQFDSSSTGVASPVVFSVLFMTPRNPDPRRFHRWQRLTTIPLTTINFAGPTSYRSGES